MFFKKPKEQLSEEPEQQWGPKKGDRGYYHYDQYAFLASRVSKSEFKKWCKENPNKVEEFYFTVTKDGTFYADKDNIFVEALTDNGQKAMCNIKFCIYCPHPFAPSTSTATSTAYMKSVMNSVDKGVSTE